MLTVDIRVHRTRDYYETISIYYAPDGKDIDGNGRNLAVGLNGGMLTSAYIKPEPLKLIGDDMLLETNMGSFQIIKDNRGYYTATKVD